jgi:hypothetical protein
VNLPPVLQADLLAPSQDPPGEAVAAILGLLRRREEVCLEDFLKWLVIVVDYFVI